jgi:DNA-binding transcriptional ArsR family regulator
MSLDLDAAFSALADPTRRAVIQALVAGPRRAGELADQVRMTPPALSRHLRVLRRAGIIVDNGTPEDARVRVYTLAPASLGPVRSWLEEVGAFWSDQLASFKAHAESGAAGHPQRRRRNA